MKADDAAAGPFRDARNWSKVMDAARPGDEVEEAQARAGVKAGLFGAPAPRVLLSRYLLLERIGAGALGVVYAAYDPELDRKVAIKLLRSSARGSSQERILDEARALAKLAHPNVIAVHDVGTEEGGSVFIVMELVDGSDLHRWLGAATRSQGEILDAFLGAARGLLAAHEAGLVHRDFKPSNVLVGNDGRVRVVDFGLARSGPDATGSDAVVGTPAYMAPEQHAGPNIDARADQYAFCVSLFEALHEKRPFGGRTSGELREAKQAGRIATIAGGRGRVPRAIQRALERGLSPAPEDRHPSMRELIAALERARGRRRWLWLGGGVWLFAVTAAIVLSRGSEAPCQDAAQLRDEVWNEQTRETLAQRFAEAKAPYAARSWETVETGVDAYLQRWVDARTSTCVATMVERTRPVAEMNRSLRCLDRGLEAVEALTGVLVESGEAPIERAVELVERLPPLDDCGDTTADDDEAAAEIHRAIAKVRALGLAGLHDRATEESARVVELADATGSASLIAEAKLVAGHLVLRGGDFDGKLLYEAYAAAEEAGADALATEALLRLTTIAIEKSRFDEARGLLAMADGKAKRGDLTPFQRVLQRAVLAELDVAAGSPEAIASARAFEDEARRVFGDDDTEVARAITAEGLALEAAGDIAGYVDRLAEAYGTFERKLGPDHPSTAHALSNWATALSQIGRHEEAIEAFLRARRVLAAAYGEDDNRVARVDANMGGPLGELGRFDEAIEVTARAYASFRRIYGDAHPNVGMAAGNLADLQLAAGRPAEALARADEAVAVLEAALGPDHRNTLVSVATRARARALLGDRDGARPILEDALRRLTAQLGPDHPDVVGVGDVLAELYPP